MPLATQPPHDSVVVHRRRAAVFVCSSSRNFLEPRHRVNCEISRPLQQTYFSPTKNRRTMNEHRKRKRKNIFEGKRSMNHEYTWEVHIQRHVRLQMRIQVLEQRRWQLHGLHAHPTCFSTSLSWHLLTVQSVFPFGSPCNTQANSHLDLVL